MKRVAVGGWQHETNTFAPVKADFENFQRADEWPGLSRGPSMFEGVEGIHLPVNGAIGKLRTLGYELAPLLWCSATPSAHVAEDAFERISAMLLEILAEALPVDAVFLDLHGAMVCEHLEDGDGEILRRVRDLVGPDMPVVASLDLHANVTEAMVRHANALDIFRTYPHVDMGETGARAAAHLHALLTGQLTWYPALRRTDFLIPLNWGCTLIEPAKSLYAGLPQRIGGEVAAISLACGFPLSDIAEVGPAIVAYGTTQAAADESADALLSVVHDREVEFAGRLYSTEEAVAEALRISGRADRPVVLADTQDNPGGGGPGDTTGVLKALVEADARGAVFGTIADPDVAAEAHDVGVGGVFTSALGEKSGMRGHVPFEGSFKVLSLGSGNFTATGPMYKGARMKLGPMALLEVQGVRVLVASKAAQTADQSILRHLGVEPANERILAVKSSVHFRNDFQDLAEAVFVVTAPGPVCADPSSLTFRNIRPGVRLTPR